MNDKHIGEYVTQTDDEIKCSSQRTLAPLASISAAGRGGGGNVEALVERDRICHE